MKALFLSMLVLWASAFAQNANQVKFYEVNVSAMIDGKMREARTILVESRPAKINLSYPDGDGSKNYTLQLSVMKRLAVTSQQRTYLLQTQIFANENGRKVLLTEPTIEARDGSPASISVNDKANSSVYVSMSEIPSDKLTVACGQVAGKPMSAKEVDAALQRMDLPGPNTNECCTGSCGSGISISCCGAMCCSVSTTCGCCVQP